MGGSRWTLVVHWWILKNTDIIHIALLTYVGSQYHESRVPHWCSSSCSAQVVSWSPSLVVRDTSNHWRSTVRNPSTIPLRVWLHLFFVWFPSGLVHHAAMLMDICPGMFAWSWWYWSHCKECTGWKSLVRIVKVLIVNIRLIFDGLLQRWSIKLCVAAHAHN